MGHVFISYPHAEKELADFVVDYLTKQGFIVWYDTHEIAPGMEWRAEIISAIEAASAIVAIVTERFANAPSALSEISYAQASNIPIFVLNTDPTKADVTILKEYQYLDFSPQHRQEALNRLIRELLRVILPGQFTAKQKPQKSKGYVFISYAEEDTNFVLKLQEYLKNRGYGYWDYKSSDRNYQALLFLELEEAISKAAATLSILSPDWKRSTWTPKEMMYSQDVDVPVFLLMARDMGPTLVTAGMTYIDFTNDLNSGFEKLDKELQRKGLI